jgi:uncharacterized protein YeaO (DUF488 family)
MSAPAGKPSVGKHQIQIKRVYEKPSPDDGTRFLIDRLWPRGVKKSTLAGVEWLKDVAPSTPLREWFGHEPAKWKEFQKRYRAELKENSDAWKPLLDALKKSDVTLLYGAKDQEINHAVVLKAFLGSRQ